MEWSLPERASGFGESWLMVRYNLIHSPWYRHINTYSPCPAPSTRSLKQRDPVMPASTVWPKWPHLQSHISLPKWSVQSYLKEVFCSLNASQVRFALCSSPVFSRTDTITDSERFYNTVLDLFEDVEEREEVNDLQTWWNQLVLNTLPCSYIQLIISNKQSDLPELLIRTSPCL